MVQALGNLGNPLAIPLIIEHRFHQSVDVRFAVACALGNFANERSAVVALLVLMQDADEDVRDWATFGIGTQGDLDSQEIRDALFQRMSDPHRDVREEAMAGLGKRKDKRVLPALIAELNEPAISDCVIQAAESFLSEQRGHRTPADYIAALKNQFSS